MRTIESRAPARGSARPAARRRTARLARVALGLALVAALAAPAHARTLRVANQGDALSMDPHSLAEAVQLSFVGNVYEPLVMRDAKLVLQPALATSWKAVAPGTWRFELRRGVQFHDGTPLTADDVVFSLERARGEGSDLRTQTASIRQVRKAGDAAVEIDTHAPNPILPELLTTVYVMSRAWAQANQAERPVDRRKGVENAASFRANGTGPYRLRERQPGVRTVLVRNGAYWGRIEGNVSEVVWQPIGNDGTRVAALVSGEVDLIDPVPLQDIPRIQRDARLEVLESPESRIVFLGFDQARDELLYSDVKGRNPFKDKRVRQAFYQAIDIETIRKQVMRGAAVPAGLIVARGVRGYSAELDQRLPYDPEAARRLLAEAGYPGGFGVTLNCPNDRYVRDAEICESVVAYLARIGVRARLQAETKATYFPKVLKRDTSFFMAGWSPSGYDAHNALFALAATPAAGGGGQGAWNLGAWSDPKVDALIARIQSELDPKRRDAMIHEALRIHRDDIGHLPLHQQMLAWAMKKEVDAVQRADNFMFFRWITVR